MTWRILGDWRVASLGEIFDDISLPHTPPCGFLCNAKIIQKILWLKKMIFNLFKLQTQKKPHSLRARLFHLAFKYSLQIFSVLFFFFLFLILENFNNHFKGPFG